VKKVARLANEVALLAHETKTEAIRRALEERRERLLGASVRGQSLISFLEKQVWPFIPEEVRGYQMTSEEQDQIFGCGPDGY
jgi:antitoxin VapB